MFNTKKFASLLLFICILGTTPRLFAQEKNEGNKQEVSQAELTKFATTFQKLESANRAAQQEMVKVVESQGLTMKRFNEIHVAYINPNMKSDASPEEMKKHKAAMDKIQKMQENLQTKMDAIVKETGLTNKKYQHIAETMRKDEKLREEYKKMLSTKTQSSTQE